MSCQIQERQSTFWDIVCKDGAQRIRFVRKEEFYFTCSDAAQYFITEDHPLLLDYEEDWVNLYVASAASDPAEVVNDIVTIWQKRLSGWRIPRNYFPISEPEKILTEGYGMLVQAPNTLVTNATRVLADAGVKFTTLPGRPARWPQKALVAGENYVIAADFAVEARAV